MNKLMTMVFAAVIGFSLSMPAFAQSASGQAKTGTHDMHAKSTGATTGEKAGQESVSPASAKTKTGAHAIHARKKGATAGEKEGQEGASPASPKAKTTAHKKVMKMAAKDEKK
jgi:hypothetical protein